MCNNSPIRSSSVCTWKYVYDNPVLKEALEAAVLLNVYDDPVHVCNDCV